MLITQEKASCLHSAVHPPPWEAETELSVLFQNLVFFFFYLVVSFFSSTLHLFTFTRVL